MHHNSLSCTYHKYRESHTIQSDQGFPLVLELSISLEIESRIGYLPPHPRKLIGQQKGYYKKQASPRQEKDENKSRGQCINDVKPEQPA